MSTPHWFKTDPHLAWGFFGHRLNMYRTAIPHRGFSILHKWGTQLKSGMFVFTSNVDGQFQKAGFAPDQIIECHGSIHHLQCARPCENNIWSNNVELSVDETTIRTNSELPKCKRCGGIARPNILMFSDYSWIAHRTEAQEARYRSWLQNAESHRLVTIELGAGLAIPSVRFQTESREGTLIRINPREADTPAGGISLPLGALAALQQIDALL
jgi:NAD-dependent SIR2 family protein deacetylase